LDKLEKRVSLGAARDVELRVIGNHVGDRVRNSVKGERTTMALIISSDLLAARNSRLERVRRDRALRATRGVESDGRSNI
jgi:hypothetical protein